MSHDLSDNAIIALDEQIAEMMAEITRRKRIRNSLLKIARIPPEILGRIFQFAVAAGTLDQDFSGIQKGSYNFLLVCHHWHEVGRCTEELWRSWGNNLEDWRRLCTRSGTSALDLVLNYRLVEDKSLGGSLDETLQAALKDRAARDVIRKVHLRGPNRELLASILSSLSPENEVIRDSSIESIILCNADPSIFFARHRFPKLRYLSLSLCPDFALAPLKSHTMALVNLSLVDGMQSSNVYTPTSQIISILASNPNIRTLDLQLETLGDDKIRDFREPALLCHLKEITLKGIIGPIFSILERLEFPGAVDLAQLSLFCCTPEDVRRAIGPYLLNYLQRDPRFGEKIGVSFESASWYMSIGVDVIDVGHHSPQQVPRQGLPRVKLGISLPGAHPSREEMFTDLFALLPRERIAYFKVSGSSGLEEMLAAMPNIEFLHLVGAEVHDGFLLSKPGGPNARTKLLPSLRRLYLENVRAKGNDLDPLVHYLTHETSGSQPVSLSLFGSTRACVQPETMRQLESLVEELYVCK